MKFSKIYLSLAAVILCLPVYIAYFAISGHFPSFSGTVEWSASCMSALRASLSSALLCAAVSTVCGTLTAMFINSIKKKFSVFFTEGAHYEVCIFNTIIFAALWFIIYMNGTTAGFVTLGHCMVCAPLVFCMVCGFSGNVQLMARCSAEIGMSPFQIFCKTILPSFLPASIAGFAASFIISFNDVVIAHIVSRGSAQCFSLWLINAAKSGAETGPICAVMFVVTLVTAVICSAVSIKNSR